MTIAHTVPSCLLPAPYSLHSCILFLTFKSTSHTHTLTAAIVTDSINGRIT